MVTIGVDPHKQTHTAAAVDALGVELAQLTVPARPAGIGQLLEWARALDAERVWAVEDVRNVSGSLERFLIDRGETVVRFAPQLMAGARAACARVASLIRSTRSRSRAPRCAKGSSPCPAARLAGAELEIRLLASLSRAAVGHAHPAINELRWQLHDLWPDWEIPAKALVQPGWQTKVARRWRARADHPGPDRPRHDPPRPRAHPRHQRPRRQARRAGQKGRAAVAC